MLRLSKKTLLALEAVVDIAYNARPEPVQSKEITARQGIPQRYLEQVMQQLVHAGILKGVRGARGGYTLAKERRRITVGDIVRTVGAAEEGEVTVNDTGSELARKVVFPFWEETQRDFMAQLDSISIEDLCRRAQDGGVGRGDSDHLDFTI